MIKFSIAWCPTVDFCWRAFPHPDRSRTNRIYQAGPTGRYHLYLSRRRLLIKTPMMLLLRPAVLPCNPLLLRLAFHHQKLRLNLR